MRTDPMVRRVTFGAVLMFLFLTLLTQIGGLVYLVSKGLVGAVGGRAKLGRVSCLLAVTVAFVSLYATATVFVMPPVATALRRPPLPCTATDDRPVAPVSKLFCVLNRNYAKQPVHDLLDHLARHMAIKHPGTVLGYLDAGFPFFDGFPLLPHLSHGDGLKIDLAFFYRDAAGTYRKTGTPSPIGYWAFEQPRAGDPQPCAGRNDLATLRWDLDVLQTHFKRFDLDAVRTGEMLHWLADNADLRGVDKILLERHLTLRFGLSPQRVRFQGCRAARHDDHVHVSIRPAGSGAGRQTVSARRRYL